MMHIVTDFEKNVLQDEPRIYTEEKYSSCNCKDCRPGIGITCRYKKFTMKTNSNIGEITVIPLLLPFIRGC